MVSEIGKFLRILRINRSELLKDMAQNLSITPAYLSSIENGKKAPTTSLIDKIVSVYALDESEVMDLQKAYYETINSISINLSQMTDSQKDVALAFSRKLSDLDEESINFLKEILLKKGDD